MAGRGDRRGGPVSPRPPATPPPEGEEVIAFDRVSKTFEPRIRLSDLWSGARPADAVRAVDEVSFSLARGRVLGVAGESGSGKSTLANLLLGLEEPSGGEIRFRGAPLAGLAGRDMTVFRRNVQMVFQDPNASLNPRFRIGRIVEEPLIIHGLGDRQERMDRTVAALEEAGLRPGRSFLDRFPHELSGGQRQRVSTARAIVLEPSVLIADEPVSMVDVSIRAGILHMLKRLVHDHRMALVFITHDLSLIGQMCDELAVMYRGRFAEHGPALDVLRSPLHPYTRQLIDAVPVPDPDRPPPELSAAWLQAPPEGRDPAGCRFAPRCAHAAPRCLAEVPALRTIAGPGIAPAHRAACHRVEEIRAGAA